MIMIMTLVQAILWAGFPVIVNKECFT